MRRILLFLLLIIFFSIAKGQTINTVKLCDTLFKQGDFEAAITSYDFPEEIKALQNRALTNLKNNPQWADKYLVTLVEKGDKSLKFYDEYGLTKDEFGKMLNGFKAGQRPIYTDTSRITIKKSNNLITFKCSKEISLFNFLRIDTKTNTIYLDNRKVTREIKIDGKLYAPILNGFETHALEETGSLKRQANVSLYGFSIGTNKHDSKVTLCLLYVTPAKDQVLNRSEFLVITLL